MSVLEACEKGVALAMPADVVADVIRVLESEDDEVLAISAFAEGTG